MQVFLALPSDCPTDPDGSPQPTDGQAQADSVVLYASADEAQTFEQVIRLSMLSPHCYAHQERSRSFGCLQWSTPLSNLSRCVQVCLPVRWLDLGYNLVKTHDGASAFLVVDHDEEDMIAKRAPMGNIYAPGKCVQ